ncbi:MAG: RusA family crossover junction endodeoxyribonuclease, partial [Gemmataceae bacterium]
NPPLAIELKAIIINFFGGNEPTVDVDNLSKPILDAMQGIVYDDDRQIVQAELIHSRIGAPYPVVGVRPVIVTALQAGSQFVYVRIEDPVNPLQLPR